MAITLKSAEDIEQLAQGGAILAQTLDTLQDEAKPGVTPQELDQRARELLEEQSCTPAFLNYAPRGHKPFPAGLCVSVNDALVHGLPTATSLKAGDVVGIDFGLIYQGKYFLDSARTVIVGHTEDVTPPAGASDDLVERFKLVSTSQRALQLGIEAAQVGNHIGDIGAAVQQYVEGQGYSVVQQLVGHGVGFAVHEEPQVPNFGEAGTGPVIEPGLVIAIEPMITTGDPLVKTGADGWSILIESGELAAHHEHTVAITDKGPRILTESRK